MIWNLTLEFLTKKKVNEKQSNPFGNFLETLIKDIVYDNL